MPYSSIPPEQRDQEIERRRLAADLVAAAYLRGDFVLSSGRRSDHYFDKYRFETQPDILRRLGRWLAMLVPATTDRLAAPELGAVLLGGAVSLELDLPLVIVRRAAKGHGTARLIEGELPAGARVTLIEDVVTTGNQAISAAHRLKEAGATVERLIAVIDREEGGEARIRAEGLDYHPLFRSRDLPLP
ncbi:MAG TPA: orotate phosphoribosyltransferase [Candidatus Dormibacteraeota bacterium]|nr:orotate phosphoribosyltransferase [Candidatus Dormibacteraeota bacterium]